MNHNVVKLVGATLMGGFGLWTVAMPVSAGPIMGMFSQTTEYGINPAGPVNASIEYNSVDGSPFNAPLGLTYNSNDPTSSYSFSPNPSLAQGGLGAGTVGLTAAGASTSATADVGTGTTHILASTTDTPSLQSTAVVDLQMIDHLTFLVTGNDTTITMGFSLDGLLSIGDTGSYNQEIRYSIGGADMEWDVQNGVPPYTGNTSGFDSFAFTNDTISGFNFLGTFTVTNGELLQMVFTQSMNCNDGAVCDFSNTGQMSLILPSDVSFTSTGGFLSESAASAPEPGSLLLMGLGVAALTWIRHRRVVR